MGEIIAEYDENGEMTSIDGFSETDEKGVTHQVVWEEHEVLPNTSYEVWWCELHDRIYYGGCV